MSETQYNIIVAAIQNTDWFDDSGAFPDEVIRSNDCESDGTYTAQVKFDCNLCADKLAQIKADDHWDMNSIDAHSGSPVVNFVGEFDDAI